MKAYRRDRDGEAGDFMLSPRSVCKIVSPDGDAILALIHLCGFELTGVSYPSGPLQFMLVHKQTGVHLHVPNGMQAADLAGWSAYMSKLLPGGSSQEVDHEPATV
jgi:hypothetical protein